VGLAFPRLDWRSGLVIVKPETVVAWHRKAFRIFWTWKIRRGKPGRPADPLCVLVLAHNRRRILHFAVTAHPTAEWTPQQMREAFPWESAPHYLLRDRYRILRPRLR
jgi:hypothetical protein